MKRKGQVSKEHEKTNPEDKRVASKGLDISERIVSILEAKGWTQKDLAEKMEKSESEISKLLSGLHDLTLKIIIRLETILGEDIIIIPQSKKHSSYKIHGKKEVIGEYLSSMISPSVRKNAPYMGAFPNKWTSIKE